MSLTGTAAVPLAVSKRYSASQSCRKICLSDVLVYTCQEYLVNVNNVCILHKHKKAFPVGCVMYYITHIEYDGKQISRTRLRTNALHPYVKKYLNFELNWRISSSSISIDAVARFVILFAYLLFTF